MLSVAERVHIPEVLEAEEKLPPDLQALRRFAYTMDEVFEVPGTRIRFGVDAVIGLVPGIGDVIGGFFSTWVIIGALRHRVPMRHVLRMLINVAIDVMFGSVPVAGDLFDMLFEVNMRNMRLLERHRDRQRGPRPVSQILFVTAGIVAAVALIGVIVLITLLLIVLRLIGDRPWL
jgi:hypothetical protein